MKKNRMIKKMRTLLDGWIVKRLAIHTLRIHRICSLSLYIRFMRASQQIAVKMT